MNKRQKKKFRKKYKHKLWKYYIVFNPIVETIHKFSRTHKYKFNSSNLVRRITIDIFIDKGNKGD